MRRLKLWLWTAAALTSALAQQSHQPKQEPAPPEEDENIAVKEYSFNPLQAVKEIRIGNYYFKKGSYRAAAKRFEEAAKWDASNVEAYLRLGEACEKQRDPKRALEAYTKYLELAPDSKNAAEIKKRAARLRK